MSNDHENLTSVLRACMCRNCYISVHFVCVCVCVCVNYSIATAHSAGPEISDECCMLYVVCCVSWVVGAILGVYWEDFGATWVDFGALLGYVGAILGPLWEVLGGTWARYNLYDHETAFTSDDHLIYVCVSEHERALCVCLISKRDLNECDLLFGLRACVHFVCVCVCVFQSLLRIPLCH